MHSAVLVTLASNQPFPAPQNPAVLEAFAPYSTGGEEGVRAPAPRQRAASAKASRDSRR